MIDKRNWLQLVLAVWSVAASPRFCGAATYVVSPTGDDRAAGTREKPFATVQHAATIARAGDEVVLRGGTYPITHEIRPGHSGTQAQWIVFRAVPGETAVIDAGEFTKAGPNGVPPSRLDLGAFHLEGVGYIRLENLGVRNSHYVGIMLTGAQTHHIEVRGCRVDRTYGPGIFLRGGAEHCRVLGCEVTGANDQDLRVAGQRLQHEAPHEAISIADARFFEVASNHVHHCVKEGIDCKERSAHGVIHHNRVHDLKRQGLYVDCWFGLLEDVEFHSNVSYGNEWGLAISAEGAGARMDNVRIHHNVLYDNRGSGIYFGTWGTNGPRTNIFIYNNTVCGNGHVDHWAGLTGGIDVRAGNVQKVFIVNNIVFGNGAYEIATFAPPDQRDVILKSREIVIANNLTGPFRPVSGKREPYGAMHSYRGEQTIEADPLFADPTAGDFRLRPGSPALGKAKKLIPFNGGPDLGALGR